MPVQTVQVKGLKELAENLKKIGKIAQVDAGVAMTVAGARVFQRAAKANVPVKSGRLRKSIIVKKVFWKGMRPLAVCGIKTKGKGAGYHAHLIEFGTKPHLIPKEGKPGKKPMLIPGAGRPIWVVKHPGSKPHSFMRRAFNENWEKAIKKMGKTFEKRLEKWKNIAATEPWRLTDAD